MHFLKLFLFLKIFTVRVIFPVTSTVSKPFVSLTLVLCMHYANLQVHVYMYI